MLTGEPLKPSVGMASKRAAPGFAYAPGVRRYLELNLGVELESDVRCRVRNPE